MSRQIETPEQRSWRAINQGVSPRVMSTPGRRRLGMNIARAVFTVAALAGLALLGVYLLRGFDETSEALAPVVKSEPLREIIVLTDGVLTRAWAEEALQLPEGITLMAVDLAAARAALARTGQVRSVVVSREFPDTLVVTVTERVPVIRINAAIEPGRVESFVVSRDGVIYRPINNAASMLKSLPSLYGVRLIRQGDGFEPLAGIDRVSDLLLAVQQEAPHLAPTWRVISLEEAPRLIVRTPDIRQIVFDSVNFRRQLAWLDHILDQHARERDPRAIDRIDLSIAARAQPPSVPQVVVKYAAATPPAPTRSGPTPSRSTTTRTRDGRLAHATR